MKKSKKFFGNFCNQDIDKEEEDHEKGIYLYPVCLSASLFFDK
jgi:hypothetical protein